MNVISRVVGERWANQSALCAGLTLLLLHPACDRPTPVGPGVIGFTLPPELGTATSVGPSIGTTALDYEARFIGSRECATCHAGHGQMRETHRMALTGRRVTPQNLDAWFSAEQLAKPLEWPASEGNPAPRYRREGAKVFLESRDAGGETVRAEAAAMLGSGNRGLTPIALGSGKGIRELRVTFMGPKDCWTMTPGAAGDPDPLGYVRSQEMSAQCLGCHATLVAWGDDRLDLDRTVFGIECERCHGPGSAHVEAVLAAKESPMIYNPSRLRRDKQVELCSQCHRRPADLEPHNVLKVDPSVSRHAGSGLMLSRCFRRSPPESTITCVECHDPHRNIDRARDDFNRSCRRCHSNPEGLHKTAGITAASDCVTCHMKAETEGFFGHHFTNHWIRHPGKPEHLEGDERREYVQLLEQDYRDAIARPGAGPEKSATLRMRLGKLLVSDGDRNEGLGWFQKALAFAPLYKDRLQAADLHARAGKPEEAVKILEAAVRIHPENNWAYNNLARLHAAAGRLGQAEAVLEAWSKARPGDPALESARRELQQLKKRN